MNNSHVIIFMAMFMAAFKFPTTVIFTPVHQSLYFIHLSDHHQILKGLRFQCLIMCPATLNSLSTRAEDAGMARYLFANFARDGYSLLLVFQKLKGSSSI